jgi:multidrug efflux pump subunit AcrB
MRVVEVAVRRHQFTIVVFLMLATLGISSLMAIPKAEDPTFPSSNFIVVSIYPGATPTDLEKLVVDPLETKMKALDDVKTLRTEITDSLAVTRVEFFYGTDPDKKRDDVLREVTSLRPSLPAAVTSMDVQRWSPANVSVLQVALVSEATPYHELELYADRLKKRLESLPGVKEAKTWGIPPQEVRVELDLERLAALGIPPTQVAGALQSANVNIPGGTIDAGATRLSVKTSGDYASLDQIRDTVVAGSADGVIYLRDVAKVALGDGDPVHVTRYNGHRAVFVTAAMKEGEDIFSVERALKREVEQLRKGLPSVVSVEEVFDQSQNVEHRLSGFERDFAIAIALVLITLLPLGLRASMVVMISIPLSLAIGLTLLRFLGFSINQLSIVGFVIALGLLVDDSIVVVENIARHLREGRKPIDAAIEGTKQIAVSVIGCTATLLFAFLPLLFLPGGAGQFIRSLPVAVVVTVAASLLVALTIIPFLASRMLKPEGHEGNRVLVWLTHGIERSYRPILHRALARPWLTIGIAAALFFGALALVPRIGFSLFPKSGIPQFRITVRAKDGASLAETDRAARFAEDVLGRHREIIKVATNVGEGNPMVYYNVAQQNQRAGFAELFCTLTHFDPKQTPALFETLRSELNAYPGARIELREFEQGLPLDAPIAMRVIGEDFAELEKLSAEVEQVMRDTEGTRDVDDPAKQRKIDLRVAIDRERAGALGVQMLDLDRSVRLGVSGLVVGQYHEPGHSEETRDINLTLPRRRAFADLATLDRVWIPTTVGAQVPLSQVATIELEGSPIAIRHWGKERSVTVTAQVLPGYNTDRVTKAVLAKLDAIKIPPGYRLEAAGEIESRQESFGGMGAAIVIAIFGVFAVLVLEFQTFKSTLIVASVIPLGIIGGMLALFLTGNTLSFTASVGFIALIGIEVKNSILLVDFTNHLRKDGVALDLAIERAGEARFLPILLTTLTALGGLLPIALEGSALYSPLAWVIIGGLITSTVLTRVVTPVVYRLLAPEIEVERAPAPAGTPVLEPGYAAAGA